MISIGKVRDADYYVKELGREDASGYYIDTERSGRWHGQMSSQLGLTGEVAPADFRSKPTECYASIGSDNLNSSSS